MREERAAIATLERRAAAGLWPCGGADACGGELVEVDGGEIREQCVKVADRPGGEHPVHAVTELFSRQPPHGVVLAKQRRGPIPVRVRGAHRRLTGHLMLRR